MRGHPSWRAPSWLRSCSQPRRPTTAPRRRPAKGTPRDTPSPCALPPLRGDHGATHVGLRLAKRHGALATPSRRSRQDVRPLRHALSLLLALAPIDLTRTAAGEPWGESAWCEICHTRASGDVVSRSSATKREWHGEGTGIQLTVTFPKDVQTCSSIHSWSSGAGAMALVAESSPSPCVVAPSRTAGASIAGSGTPPSM